MSNVITIGNFKGGVGKTTACVLFSYLLNREGKKTLLIDFDPQSNSTEIIKETYKVNGEPEFTFFESLERLNIQPSILRISDNLDLIPADWNLSKLPDLLEEYKKQERYYLLKELIKPIKDNYDYILIDVPPTLSGFTNNAVIASDYVLMVLQTQQQAFSSSVKFINYLKELRSDYHTDFELLGIIQYLIKKDGKVDSEIIKASDELFGEAVLDNKIYQRERIKRFGKNGITDNDTHDERVLFMYSELLQEIENRIKEIN
ncbi:ParA family protein [Enterococcus sp. AZ103]|uniref:ParA family protein n=1 Tax=Enterococcus sp. AZ103 TaxID=2774628 RepID=UPI003F1FD734